MSIELDAVRCTATRDGVRLDLSAKELGVLEALLRAVWDENAGPFTKTVQVTIGRLRRKLGPPDAIDTALGVGYGIDAGAG